MHKNVLITGASGLIGSRLSAMLMQKGYQISKLSRSRKQGDNSIFEWNIENQTIDKASLSDADAIIHLAGAGIADKPWTPKRKKEILESRTRSSELLYNALKNQAHQVKVFLSASAIGYYGYAGSEKFFTEESPPANDFLADVVRQWESAVDKIATLGIRVVKIRIGILLSEKGGALAELVKPIRWGVGSPLGTGNQYMSWIHIDDLCRIFIKSLEDESLSGPYNAVSPNPATNEEVTKAIARVIKKPIWLPNVPVFALKMILGEMADLVVNGSKVSSTKIESTGFIFEFPQLENALKDLLAESE